MIEHRHTTPLCAAVMYNIANFMVDDNISSKFYDCII